MRDAFGGAFMIQIFLVFIFVYIGFTALALNYAKAFKVKNTVIEYLESNEITDLNLTAQARNAMEEFFNEEILGNMNYNLSGQAICKKNGIKEYNEAGEKIADCSDLGIVIQKSGSAENTEGVYYTVSTYVGWSIPFLNKLLALDGSNKEPGTVAGYWQISGQTRLIVNEQSR